MARNLHRPFALRQAQKNTSVPVPPIKTRTIAKNTATSVVKIPAKPTVPVIRTITAPPVLATGSASLSSTTLTTSSSTLTLTSTTSSSTSPSTTSSTSSRIAGTITVTISTSASRTPTTAKSSSTPTTVPSGGLGAGSIIGIVGGCLVAVAFLSFTISFFVRRWRRRQGESFGARQFRRSAILLDDPVHPAPTPSLVRGANREYFPGSIVETSQHQVVSPQYPQPTYGQQQIPYSGPTPYPANDTNPSYPESYNRHQAHPSHPPHGMSNAEPSESRSQPGLQRSGTIYNPEDAYGGID